MTNSHDGHRERLRKRFELEGLAGFEDHQALELLLFYAIPRRDTNDLAHRLLQTFGSLKNLFEADVSDIAKVDGMGGRSAALIKLLPEMAAKYWFAPGGEGKKITSIESAAAFANSLLYGKPLEHFYAVCLDAAFKVKYTTLISKGTPSQTPVFTRHVAEAALRSGTDKVIVAHNHPGGEPRPSKNDIEVTLKIASALETLDIQFIDHIIIAESGYFSFAAEQLIRDNFTEEQARAAKYTAGVMNFTKKR